MNLLEFEGKELFREYGIPVPSGILAKEPIVLDKKNLPAVVKAQVPIGGRGKAGGIITVKSQEELDSAVTEILGKDIRGYRVGHVLIEELIDIQTELYLGITVDRSKRNISIMASSLGGMDIEAVPHDEIITEWVDPWIGLQPYNIRNMTFSLGLKDGVARDFHAILSNLWRLFQEMDAELVEINPLVVKANGGMTAADAKVILDDDALFRHAAHRDYSANLTELEKKAKKKGITFVQLDGDIGIIANGAGLTMATLDFLTSHGGRGGVFLDLGGTDDPEKVKEALMLMAEARPKAVLLNIFGGITKCDTVAKGLLEAIQDEEIDLPIVARIKGVNEKEAVELLKGSDILPVLSLDEATKEAVKLSSGGG